ncbi:hypothetical protein F4859DRAFT_506364 [Xylaria cf. heliscus]|nr:hypothetical protein F4859DRAFT_506364 [Xylaria cf. heliscus]
MEGDVESSETPSPTSTSTSPSDYVGNVIRSACESDMEAIVEVETISFPQVYPDATGLANYRRRELEGGYPYYKILEANSEVCDQSAVYGFIIFESYLRSFREYRDSKTGEGIVLPANRPRDKKPAYSILMAAIRADPDLLEEEFLFVSEICIHPHVRDRGNGTRLMHHMVEMADILAVKIIVLVEGSVSDAAQQWTTDEAEEVDVVELMALREREQRTTVRFYERKLGFRKRAYFFWGRRDSAIPRIFHVMQYPAHG